MKTTSFILVSALALIAGTASAATPARTNTPAAAAPAAAPAAPAFTPPTFGAPVAGQCVLNEDLVLNNSAMGRAASERMGQIYATVQAELAPENEALDTEYQQIIASKDTTPAAQQAQWEAKAQAWMGKRQGFEAKVDLRQREVAATEQKVQMDIFNAMIPHINASVTAKACSTVVPASSLLQLNFSSPPDASGQVTRSTFTYANPAMDITQDVIQRLDASGARLPQINRVSLEQPAQAAPQR